MSRQLTYEIVADGGTDRVLMPVVQWAIHRIDPTVEILEPDFRKRRGPAAEVLEGPESGAMMVYVHRDSESASLEERMLEFDGVDRADVVPVVPVRMSEAWILFDGAAIAQAAGRPSVEVSVPSMSEVEGLANPKQLLEHLLHTAAGSPTGRRNKLFRRSMIDRRVNVASLIRDFSPLEQLSAFRRFQEKLAEVYPYGGGAL